MADTEVGRRTAVRQLQVVAVVIGVLLIGAGVPNRAVDAVRPPDLFGPGFGDDATLIVGSMTVGETLLVGMSSPAQAVALDDVEVVVDSASAVAAVQLLACQRREGSPALGSTLGSAELAMYCEALYQPTDVEVGGPVNGQEMYLLAVVQPLEAGRILLEGMEVTHSRGPLHRTERTGVAVEIVAS